MAASSESEVIAQQVSAVSEKVSAVEARLAEIDTVIGRLEGAAIAIEKSLAATVADEISQVVAQRGRAHAHDDDVGQAQLIARVGQKTGQQENGFSGNGDSGVFQ